MRGGTFNCAAINGNAEGNGSKEQGLLCGGTPIVEFLSLGIQNGSILGDCLDCP